MNQHETRYATTQDGLSIAYQVLGSGPPDLLWVPGAASHVELFWQLPGFAYTFERLASFSRLALLDKRGTGLSDRTLGTGSIEDRVQDMVAVMDAAAFSSAVIVGTSEAAALCAFFAATYPERTEALVIIGGDVTGSWIQSHPGISEIIEREWATGRLLQQFWLNGSGSLDDLGPIARAMGTPRAMAEVMRKNESLDARAVLPSIAVPTLVLHCEGDPVVPVEAGRSLAAQISGARYVEIPAAFHGSNDPADMALYVDEIERFVTGTTVPSAHYGNRVLSTVMFTDIVGSTERAAALGDDGWTRLLAEHDRIARRAVERFGGRWIKSTGDGLLATFDGPARAIAAAQVMARNLEAFDVAIRAGIHTGEIELRDDDIGGLAVHAAARVAAAAGVGEILVSPTVPGLVVGSGLRFADRGEFTLKGIPEPWHLHAVVED